MSQVLRIEQNHDWVTKYCQAFRNEVVFIDFDHGLHTLSNLLNDDAVSSEVASVIATSSIDFVTAVGHGKPSSILGQDQMPLWDAGDDLSPLRGLVVHLLSCQSGAILGRKMIESGVVAFWGYATEFIFPSPEDDDLSLSIDNSAALFLYMDALVDRGILQGLTGDQIFKEVGKYATSAVAEITDSVVRGLFIDNCRTLVCPSMSWGDPSIRLSP
jgi:hypothetical protein